jgi:Ca2+/H+ antiporter, TMEM165/GDT1 family
MDVFLFTLLLVFAIALGGRDQMMVAGLSDRLGQSPLLLVVGIVCAGMSAAAMAWLGSILAEILPERGARMLIAFALAAAAVELAWPLRGKTPAEPTRSLGAIAIVLLARQISDAARFVIFAFAAWTPYPLLSALGGALAGAAAVGLGWSLGAQGLARYPLVWWRRGLAACLLVVAIFLALDARFAAT